MKGLPMTYNRDMQEDKEPLFDAADQLRGSLEMARVVVESTRLNPARPAAAAEESWVVATDLAEALARSGTAVSSGASDRGPAGARKRARRQETGRLDAPRALAAFAPEFTPDMARCSIPAEGMKTREIPGGTGPAAVARGAG